MEAPKNMNELLEKGELLPLMESFYSLQGEGFHAGTPAWFVRIGGCDVGCHWCDVKESWDARLHPPAPVSEIVSEAQSCPARAVVVTGGEPLLYNLDKLCMMFHDRGFKTFLETSGSEKLSGSWDWICLSPKRNAPPLPVFYEMADELKVIIQEDADLEWAEKQASKLSSNCILYLQPEWSRFREVVPLITDYALQHTRWKVSVQIHKFLRIP
jgi:7-carboxy-7-deazaguanine synthase